MTASPALAFRPQRGGTPPLRLLPEPDPDDFGVIPRKPWKLVTARAKAIFGTLAILAQSQSEFWASHDEVIEATGVWTDGGKECSIRTLQRAIAELVAAGILEANEIGRGFRFLFRIKGRTARKDTVFRPAEPQPAASNLSPPTSNLSLAASNLSPPSSRETTTNYTTTPESSSSLASPPEDGDQLRALGVRIAKLWDMDEDYATNLLGHWARELGCDLDRVDHAVMLAEARKSKPIGPSWIRGVLAEWKRVGEPPRPVAPKPRPVTQAASVRIAEPVDAPLREEMDEWFATAADDALPPWRRAHAVGAIREAVRDGHLDASVLEGLEEPPPRMQKPAAGPATNYPRSRPQMTDSRGDSSLNAGSEQDSPEAPVLRSALSDRVLRACSHFQAMPPDPAGTGGS